MIKEIKISLLAKIDNRDRLIYTSKKKTDDLFSLVEYLKTYTYVISEQYGYDDYFNNTIIKNFKNIIYLKIELTDETDNIITKMIKVNSNKYTNNKWFYKKINHI